MNFDFSEEQNQLRDQVRKVLGDLSSSTDVRKVLDTDLFYSEPLWKTIIDLGWPAISLPEIYGGLALSYVDLCVVAEELGRAVAPVPFSSSVYLAMEALLLAGSDEQKQKFLPLLAGGAEIGTLASTDEPSLKPSAGKALSFCVGSLNGSKLVVPDGSYAGFAVVSAHEESAGISLFWVDLKHAGVTRNPLNTLDPSRNFARLDFADVPAQRLGASGMGSAILDQVYHRAAVLFAFEQLGGAQAALDMSVAYAKQRYAFGRPIGGFQAIKHKLADLYCLVELARSNCYYAAWDLSRASIDAPIDSAVSAAARLSATKAYEQCSAENIHVHGGMGFTWELDCHLHYRRSKTLALALGSERHWRKRLMDSVDASYRRKTK